MRTRSRVSLGLAVLASAVALFALSAGSAAAASFNCSTSLDNFNRADSIGLGTNWTVRSPKMNVAGNVATNPEATTGLATWDSVVPTQQACLDVAATGGSTEYAAAVLGYADEANNIFVKVQGGAGSFSTAYFYYGNNGECHVTGGCSFPITPFSSGRIHVSLNSSTGEVTLDIDTNFDNVPDQSLTVKYTAPFTLGNAIGIGDYGGASIDNFATAPAPTPAPTPTPTPAPSPTPVPPAPITTPPAPNTKVTKAKIESETGTAKFTFSATGNATGFECALAKKGNKLKYHTCRSPKTYSGLGSGRYTFKVRAVGPGGTDSTPATKKFKI